MFKKKEKTINYRYLIVPVYSEAPDGQQFSHRDCYNKIEKVEFISDVENSVDFLSIVNHKGKIIQVPSDRLFDKELEAQWFIERSNHSFIERQLSRLNQVESKLNNLLTKLKGI